MSEHVWAKVYLELPTDPKLIGRSAHDRYLWVCLILLAKSSPKQGKIPAWQNDCTYLAKYTAIPKPEIVRALIYFREVGMVDYEGDWLTLARFTKRQATTDPTAAERMRKLRERSDGVTRTLRVEAEAEGRGLTSPSPKEAEADRDSLGPRAASNDRPATVNFYQPDAEVYASGKGFSPEQIAAMVEKFLNHHAAGGWKRTGGVVIKDRMAAWRTWVANELERKGPNGNGHAPVLPKGMAAMADWRRRMDEQDRIIEGEVAR